MDEAWATAKVGALPVSLVVPVLNEQATIARLLGSIAAQTRPPGEVIIVDGGSTDGTVDWVREVASQRPEVLLIEAHHATPGLGRNIGIEAAHHDWIALTDAGIELDAHWLERLWRVATSDVVDVVYGTFQPRSETLFARIADLGYVPAFTSGSRGPVRSDCVASCLLRRSAWELAGRFPDLRAAEDRIFMRRLVETGARTACAPEARVTWDLAQTPRRTFQRFRNYSKHNVLAGEQRNWHYRVARQWLVGATTLGVAGLGRRPRLGLIVVAAAVARGVRTLLRRREGRSWWWVVHPARLAGVLGVLVLLDLAMFVGWIEGLAELRRRARAL